MFRRLHMTALSSSPFTSRFTPSEVLNASGQHPEPLPYQTAPEHPFVKDIQISADISSEIWNFRKDSVTLPRVNYYLHSLISHASMTLGEGRLTSLSKPTRTARMAASKTQSIMAKQMMEISTAKSVDNALGDYISRTRDGRAWTKDDYDYQNNKGEQGRQYGVRDWSRASLNFEVVSLHGKPVIQPIDHAKPSLQERWQRRIDEGYKAVVHTKKGDVKKPIKKSEVKIVKMELGGNRERMHELAFDRKVNLGKRGIGTNGSVQRRQDIEDWAKDCYNHLAKKYGAANIIDFVVHLDETNPHVHVTIVPLTQDGKLSYTELFGGSHAQAVKAAQEQGTKPNFQRQMSDYVKQLHTDFHKEVGERWGLERGDDIKITGNTHKSTAESLREHNHLEEEISQLEDTRTRTESSVLSLTSRHDQLKGEVEELEDAWHRADESLTLKNQALAKIGMKPVRPTTELEDENERLRLEKERAERVAREEKEKATAATEKAKTAYSDGVAAGKHQMESSVTAKVDAAKEEVRQSLPAEIRKMAHFKAVENDSIDQVANGWRWNFDERKKAEKEVKELKDNAGTLEKTIQDILTGLMGIPIIRLAVNAIKWAFSYPEAIKNWGFNADRVKTIGAALDLAEDVDKRKQLANTLVDLAHDDYRGASQTTVDMINKEMEKIATGTHKHLAQGLDESVGLHL